jgi:hypothetical protein
VYSRQVKNFCFEIDRLRSREDSLAPEKVMKRAHNSWITWLAVCQVRVEKGDTCHCPLFGSLFKFLPMEIW